MPPPTATPAADARPPPSHEELLQDLYRAMLRDLRTRDVTPASPLGVRLREVSQRSVVSPRTSCPRTPSQLQPVPREYIDHRSLGPDEARLTVFLFSGEALVITGWPLIKAGWAALFTEADELRIVRRADIAGSSLRRAEDPGPKPPSALLTSHHSGPPWASSPSVSRKTSPAVRLTTPAARSSASRS